MTGDELIYLDHAATTPVDPRVLDAMLPWLRDDFGNAASRHHLPRRRAAAAVETAREQVATVLNADPREICFTSGATEANNLALLGLAGAPAYATRRHVVTVRTEHKAVLDPCHHLEGQGFELTVLGVDANGQLDLDALAAALRDDTLVVSAMHANNETGVLHPIADIGRLCRDRGVLFHTDATQSFTKEPIDVATANIDLLSLSAHKIYGPKGVGALYVRSRGPRVRLAPLIHGGGHERGLRSGTANVPGIVGLGESARLAYESMADETARLRTLRDRLRSSFVDRITGTTVIAASSPRLATVLNVTFDHVDADHLLRHQTRIAASTAAACTSATIQPSHVLGALGLTDSQIDGAIRFSLGSSSSESQIEATVQLMTHFVAGHREDPPAPQC